MVAPPDARNFPPAPLDRPPKQRLYFFPAIPSISSHPSGIFR